MTTLLFLQGFGAMEILVLFIILALYFVPAIIARRNRNSSTVFWINLLFGWSVIGWLVALVMAFADSKETVIVQNNKADKYDQLQKLEDPRSKGVLSTEEFIVEKEKIMKS